jgi:hypothetical protein
MTTRKDAHGVPIQHFVAIGVREDRCTQPGASTGYRTLSHIGDIVSPPPTRVANRICAAGSLDQTCSHEIFCVFITL